MLKPRAIRAFEKRFECTAGRFDDVFFLRVADNWEDFFRTAFCFINNRGLNRMKLTGVNSKVISNKGVIFSGFVLNINIWGSKCSLVQGVLFNNAVTSDVSPVNLNNGVYILAPVGRD